MVKPITPPRVDVIGVPITATNMQDCIAFIDSTLDAIKGEYICVSNAHTCVMAHDDPSYWKVQTESVMSIPDGKPLSVVGRRKIPSMSRVTGPDLMREIFSLSAQRGWKHYFYGERQETLTKLQTDLLKTYPGLSIVGMEPSAFRPLSDEEKGELAAKVNNSSADFLWVALGAPRQEILCNELKGCTSALMVGVGGALKVLAGIIPEAPRWMQDVGLEWFYRLIQEPKRLFGRYVITNMKFILYQLIDIRRKGM